MAADLFDIPALASLVGEFRRAMQRLLLDLCQELQDSRLPVGFFRMLADRLSMDDFDHWKVVGWIESVNDLVYFEDIRRQLAYEPDQSEFAEQLLAHCQEAFYENSYLDELFPHRKPDRHRLPGRLSRLCGRLTREITQESLFLIPGLACQWVGHSGRRRWIVDGTLAANLERAELPGTIAIGVDGAYVQAPRALARNVASVRFIVTASEIRLQAGRTESRICTAGKSVEWDWFYQRPESILPPDPIWKRGLTLGPTLVYDRQRIAKAIRPSPSTLAPRIRQAIATIADAWPDGLRLLALLTWRIVPLRANGVVSFSYRHRPGLSFINLFDRTQLDLVDDLIHENSHHHLNLLLRKHVLYNGDHNQEIFYSPWRRSLRPLRGILHATFTFTMGALLFDRLSTYGRRKVGKQKWKANGLTARDFTRAQSRCVEESRSVRYSIQDLEYAATQLGWLPKEGKGLLRALDRQVTAISRRSASYRKAIGGTSFARELAQHERTLQEARSTYGPR